MSNRTILVTGANRGIGKAIVQGLSQLDGTTVLLGSRDLEAGKAAASQIGGNVSAVALDVGNRGTLEKQVSEILSRHGPIGALVNNAGILRDAKILELAAKDFEDSLRVNLTGPFDLIRLLAPQMIENGYGRIVNVSSGWGSFGEGLGGPVAYAVSKAALNALTVKAAAQIPDCIKINSMCPGWVRTDMGGKDADRSPEEGADTAVWLATLPEDGPTGGFFRDRKPIEW